MCTHSHYILLQGIVEFDVNGTRLPHDTTILKYRSVNEGNER